MGRLTPAGIKTLPLPILCANFLSDEEVLYGTTFQS
jgi:hypothetical protein